MAYVNLPTVRLQSLFPPALRFLTLLPGDQPYRAAEKLPFTQHWVVYTAPIAYGPNGEDIIHADEYGSRWDFLARVFWGRMFHIRRTAQNAFEQQLIVQRAIDKLGEPYNLFAANCEHLANYAAFGVPTSQQVVKGTILGLGALAIWYFGTSDN